VKGITLRDPAMEIIAHGIDLVDFPGLSR